MIAFDFGEQKIGYDFGHGTGYYQLAAKRGRPGVRDKCTALPLAQERAQPGQIKKLYALSPCC
jgi:hypothetical protein